MKKLTQFMLLANVLMMFGAVNAQAEDKVQICHVPPDDPENVQILEVGAAAAQKHIDRHGDYIMPAVEICDGKDNDCDREVDEDFTSLGASCSEGIGACKSEGSEVCSPDGSGTVCSAIAGEPGPEICNNGIDDDCDGDTDCGDSDCDYDPACKVPKCGDGFVDINESCDDSNTTDGDCCSSTCQLDTFGTPCGTGDGECVQLQCNGNNTACAQVDTDGHACAGNGVDACSEADTCLHGVCQDNGTNAVLENTEALCSNGIDDDCSGAADAADPLCGEVCRELCQAALNESQLDCTSVLQECTRSASDEADRLQCLANHSACLRGTVAAMDQCIQACPE